MTIGMGRLKNKRTTTSPIWRRIKREFEGIHDRFQKDSTFRESQISIDRTEEVCVQVGKVAQKDFTN